MERVVELFCVCCIFMIGLYYLLIKTQTPQTPTPDIQTNPSVLKQLQVNSLILELKPGDYFNQGLLVETGVREDLKGGGQSNNSTAM